MNKNIKTAAGFAAAMLLACQAVTFSQKTPDNTNDPNRTPPVSPQGAPAGGDTATSNSANTLDKRGNVNAKDWDSHFAWNAAQDNMTEIQLAKVAEQKAEDPQVKQLAAQLVKDHEQAGQQLKQIAQEKGMRLPMQADELGVAKVAALEKASGPDFDRMFVYGMVGDHHTDVLWYRTGTELITDPQLKQFAETTLMTIKHHLHAVERLANAGEAMTAGEHLRGNDNRSTSPQPTSNLRTDRPSNNDSNTPNANK